MNFTDTQRAAVVRLLDKLGPDAPTILDWPTLDLAAHLWVRENDPLALPGIGLAAFAGLTEERMARAKQKFSYSELVRRIKNPPIWTKAMRPANAVEFFVHKMDILRADPALEYAPTSRADEDTLWRYAKLMGRRLRTTRVGVVLERSDTGDTHRAVPGAHTVTVLGRPTELIVYLTGRLAHADVRFIGTDDEADIVRKAALGL